MPAQNKKRVSVNLLPRDEEDKTLTNRIIHWLLTTFRFLVITVELLVILGFLSRFFLDSQNSDLTDEINQKKALIASYLPFETEFKLTQKRIDIAKNHIEGHVLLSSVLAAITPHVVTGMQLVSAGETGDTVTIRAQGRDEQIIAAFTESLKKESLFQDIQVSAIESVRDSDQVTATIVGKVVASTIPAP